MVFRIALLQLAPCASLEKNLEKGIEFCRKAKKMGAHLALFPEMWSTGYTIPQNPAALSKAAVSPDGEYFSSFARLAKEINMAIAVTALEAHDPSPQNSVAVFDRWGKRILSYAKVHTCDFGEERVLTPGNAFPTASLDTPEGEVKIGAMICYDREFPESARLLMLSGAEIILVPNACPMEINRISQLRGRAYENMVGIATCNYPASVPDCNGNSNAFDGVAYLTDLPGSRDTCILRAGEEEGIFLAQFSMDTLRRYRETEIHGNCYRRPEMYSALISSEIHAPFLRVDKR